MQEEPRYLKTAEEMAAENEKGSPVGNNTRLTENDLPDYMKVGEREHVRNAKHEQIEAGENPVLTSAAEVKRFIKDAVSGKIRSVIKAYGKVGNRFENDVRTASNGKTDIGGYYLEIDANRMAHLSDHVADTDARNIPLTEEQLLQIPEYIDNYDDVLSVTKKKDGGTRIALGKRINGHSVVIVLASKGRRSVQPVTAWANTTEHYEKVYGKNKKKTQIDTSRPAALAGEDSGYKPASSKKLIPDSGPEVKAEEPRYLKTAEEMAAEPTLEELMAGGRATQEQQEAFIRKYGEEAFNRLVIENMQNGRIDGEGNDLVWKAEEPRYLQRAEDPAQQLQAEEPQYLRTAEGQTAQEMQEPRYLKTAEEMTLEEPGVHGDTAWMSREDADYLSQLAKAAKASIEVVDTLGDAQGTYDPKTGRIRIAKDATDPVGFVTQHELTHRIRDNAPQQWGQFLDYVQKHYGEDWDSVLEGYQRRYAEHDIELTAEEAAEEAAADFAGRMNESDIRRLTQENRSLAQKILDAIRDLIRRLKGGESQKLYEMEKLWASALKEGNKNTAGRRNAESTRSWEALQSRENGATINEKTTKTEEGPNNDGSRTRGTGNAAQESEQNERGGEPVRRTAAKTVRGGAVLGGQRELTPSFGEAPRRCANITDAPTRCRWFFIKGQNKSPTSEEVRLWCAV